MRLLKSNRNKLLLFFLIMSVTLLTHCNKLNRQNKKICIAFIFANQHNFFFDEMINAIMETAQKNNVKIITIENQNISLKEQDFEIEKLLELNIKGVMIVPGDRDKAKKNLIPLITELNKHKIPIVLLHTSIDERYLKDKESKPLSFISSDYKKGGEIGGDLPSKYWRHRKARMIK